LFEIRRKSNRFTLKSSNIEARSSFVEQSTPALHGIVDGIASVSQISFVDKDLEAQEKHRGDDGI